MTDALMCLLTELESCHGKEVVRGILSNQVPHALLIPMDAQTCHEVKALSEVFDCDPSHLAFLILRTALQEIHAGLEHDLDVLAWRARAELGKHRDY